ncbi:DDE-type integrase/transposase/recombinase [Pseudomonas japonica]|nr:DDE-type integrase/transposase/recombinase [Pseudomonas japonica]
MSREIASPLVGAQYTIDGFIYEVIELSDNLVTLSTLTQLRVINISLDLFMSDLKRRNINLFADKPGNSSNAIAFLNAEDPKVIEAKRMHMYIVTTLSEQNKRLPKVGTLAIIRRLAEQTNDPHPPGYTTLCRWVKKYRDSGNDEFSLYKVPSTLPRGRQLSSEVKAQLEQIIKAELIEKQQRITLKRIFQYTDGYVLSINKLRMGGPLPLLIRPSESTVRRAITSQQGYASDAARLGTKVAREAHFFCGQQEGPKAPLELCEIDSHPLDIVVVDRRGHVLGKIAHATVIIDVFTRMVIGWELSLSCRCAETTLKAIRMAVVAVPGEENWRGTMRCLVSDGGPENANQLFLRIVDRLQIKWPLPPAKAPNTRPHIERFFKTFESWLHEQYGTTFSNPDACGDYDSVRHACYTIESLNKYFDEWLENVYHNKKHRELNMPPRVAWERAMQNQLPPRKFSAEALDALFRGLEYSALHGNRAQFFCLSWTGPNLGRIKKMLRKGERATCYYDPTDLGVIWVAAPRAPRDLVPAWGTQKSYQPGLTLSEHKLLQEQLKADGRQFDDSDAHIALLHLRQIMQEEHDQFVTTKRRHAHTKGKAKSASPPPPTIDPAEIDEPWEDEDAAAWRVD